MHEASIAKYVFEIIIEKLEEETLNNPGIKDAKIKKIVFSQGSPQSVVPDSFELYFDELCKGTRIEGAKYEYTESNEQGFIISSIEIDI